MSGASLLVTFLAQNERVLPQCFHAKDGTCHSENYKPKLGRQVDHHPGALFFKGDEKGGNTKYEAHMP
jgi:hypothetical protein